jgi:RNA polymerase sigma factor (sigma-70 family)
MILSTLIEPPALSTQMSEPLSLSSLVLGNTAYAIMGCMVLIALFGLPLLRGLSVLVWASRWLTGQARRIWTRGAPLGDPERPLSLAGLSPPLANLARQTRTLALELRRRSAEARHWPEDAGELEPVRVSWWSSLLTETLDFTPLLDTRREVFDWLQSVETLGERDRQTLAALGVEVEAVRAALTSEARVADRIRTLAGLLWAIDERLSDATRQGYRASGAQTGPGFGALMRRPDFARPRGEAHSEDEPEDAQRHRFTELLGSHGRGLSRMAGSYARSTAEREDLEQDIALALWQALPKFRGESKLETFAYRVARYCCYRHARRRGRMPTDAEALTRLGDPHDLEQQLLQADTRAEVERALAELPGSLESTLSLHLSGLSYAEIAEQLGISERNVSVRLTRARHKLRAQLAAA